PPAAATTRRARAGSSRSSATPSTPSAGMRASPAGVRWATLAGATRANSTRPRASTLSSGDPARRRRRRRCPPPGRSVRPPPCSRPPVDAARRSSPVGAPSGEPSSPVLIDPLLIVTVAPFLRIRRRPLRSRGGVLRRGAGGSYGPPPGRGRRRGPGRTGPHPTGSPGSVRATGPNRSHAEHDSGGARPGGTAAAVPPPRETGGSVALYRLYS